MKFGKQLEEYELPEWKGHYIPYKQLKNRLQDIKNHPVTPPMTPVGSQWSSLGRRQSGGKGPAQIGYSVGVGLLDRMRNPSGGKLAAVPDPVLKLQAAIATGGAVEAAELVEGVAWESALEEWRRWLEDEARRVGDFVARGVHGLEVQLEELERMSQTLMKRQVSAPMSDKACADDSEAEDTKECFLELRVLEAVGRVAEGGRRLRGFAELNHAALYKICKKHDKLMGSKVGLSQILPRLVEVTKLDDTGRFDVLDTQLRRLSQMSSQTEGLNASAEVARLAAGLGLSGTSTGGAAVLGAGARRTELVLSFFLGSSLSLFLAIGVLLALPEASPKSFSEAYFLTPMPVFRVVFSVMLSLWCMGAVARICDKSDINHMFILNVDPRCRVSPEFFFSRAATLTTLWILVFGMYVVDYKWRVLPPIWAAEGFNKRSSVHFVFYPVALIVLTLLGMVWPSRICRNRYKLAVANAACRTVAAPLYPVDFADNLVGDILTSLAKPLQDVPAAICYLVSPHPQPERFVERFVVKGDTCSGHTHRVLLPIIAGIPYICRAMQCLRRWRDTRETRNLWNFGKYVSSLMVVVVSTVWYDQKVLIVAISCLATAYAFVWDVSIDWGLGRRELSLAGQDGRARDLGAGPDRGRSGSGESVNSNPAAATVVGHASSGLSRPDHSHALERHFPPSTYWLCGAVDLLARSTWVLTLMPITVVSDNIVGRVILVSVISSIEILRRSMWAVLRIEHEQVANASGFRALLWVPSKLHVVGKEQPKGSGSNPGPKTPLLAS